MIPEISIIVATKNRPDFLYRCLLAIWKSKFINFECIVVADHCNYAKQVLEDTPFVYDNRFIFQENWSTGGILSEKNVGAISKNIGIEMARSNKICYCDDDNIIFDFHLGAFVYKKFDIAYSNFREVLWQDSPIRDILNSDIYFEGGLRLEYDPHSEYVPYMDGYKDALTMCHTKEVWKEIGGWKSWEQLGKRNEDRDFMTRANSSFSCERVEMVTAIYNQHEINENDKDSQEYNVNLMRLKDNVERYVYPQFVKRLKQRYGIN